MATKTDAVKYTSTRATSRACEPASLAYALNDDTPLSSGISIPKRRHEVALLTDLLRSSSGGRAQAFSQALLDRYGSLGALLFEVRHRPLLKVEVPEAALLRIRYLSDLLLQTCETEVRQGQILSSSHALRRYLQIDMAGRTRENFRVLFLDAANRLILDRIMWEGTVNSVQAHPREIVRLALLNDATAVILAHNHPSGQMHPSAEDHLLTQNVVAACSALDIKVHDHLIITQRGVRSMMHP